MVLYPNWNWWIELLSWYVYITVSDVPFSANILLPDEAATNFN